MWIAIVLSNLIDKRLYWKFGMKKYHIKAYLLMAIWETILVVSSGKRTDMKLDA